MPPRLRERPRRGRSGGERWSTAEGTAAVAVEGDGGGQRDGNAGGRKRRRAPRRRRCQEDEEHKAEPASVQTLNINATSSSSPQGEAVAQVSPPPGRCLLPSPGSCIWKRLLHAWGRTFYIRVDHQGCFHTYPDVGGPFRSMQQADKAIDCYLDARRDPKLCTKPDEGFSMERLVQSCLYWPDGRIRDRRESHLIEETHNEMCQFGRALVDKYNEDHNLLEDLAHELKDVLHYQLICENWSWYYHLNLTTKIKGADPNKCSMDNLFFVEVKFVKQGGHKGLLVSCLCMVNPEGNGQRCYGCTNHENVDMKHPDSSVGFIAGHLDVRLPYQRRAEWSDCKAEWSDYDDDDDKYLKAREAKIRHLHKGLETQEAWDELFTLPPGVTIVDD